MLSIRVVLKRMRTGASSGRGSFFRATSARASTSPSERALENS